MRMRGIVLVMLLGVTLAAAGCASRSSAPVSAPEDWGGSTPGDPVALYPGVTDPSGPRIDPNALASMADRVNGATAAENALASMADRVGDAPVTAGELDVNLALDGLPGQMRPQSYWVSKRGVSPYDFLLVVLDDYTDIEIRVAADASEARLIAELVPDREQSSFAPHIIDFTVGAFSVEAHERLDIPPVIDKKTGAVEPGTGVFTGSAMITWAKGRYAFKVASTKLTVSELLPVAETLVSGKPAASR